MELILALNAALALAEKLIPIIQERIRAGEISPEVQTQARERYLALRAQADAAFSGPEWEVNP
jgi:hypothetical protein